jgi:predicted nucleotidyltransferase
MASKSLINQLIEQVNQLDPDQQQRVLDYAAHLSRRLMTDQEILDTLSKRRSDLSRIGVREIGLFGSYSRGNPTPDSDMDFLVVLELKTLDNLLELQTLLEDLFHCKIDVVLKENLREEISPSVLAETQYVKGL